MLEDEAPEEASDPKAEMFHTLRAPATHHGPGFAGHYEELQHRMNKSPRNKRKIDRNTWLHLLDDGETIGLMFHFTNVVKVTPDDTITCHTGNFWTRSTFDRINQGLPDSWFVSLNKGTWYWGVRSSDPAKALSWRSGDEDGMLKYIPFSDGDKITVDGVLHAQKPPQYRKTRAYAARSPKYRDAPL